MTSDMPSGSCQQPTQPGFSQRCLSTAIIILAGITLIRMAVIGGGIEVSGDEAHYWEWSRRLDWCYYSKPPMVAWLIKIGVTLFGNTEFGIRFMAPILSFATSIILFFLASACYGPIAGATSAILLQIIPLFTLFGIGITPDTPLLFFWTLSLFFLHKAWTNGSIKYWLGLMISLGLGMLAKYAIIFFFLPAILLLIFTPQGRLGSKTPWPWLSFAGSFLFFTPVIYWNSQHNWVMFRHDMGHTHATDGLTFAWKDCLEFIGGQLGIVTPILAGLIIYLLMTRRRQDPFCFWMTIPIMAGFLLKSMQGKVQPNWAMTAWITGVIPLGYFFTGPYFKLNIHWKRTLSTGLMIALVATVVMHIPFIVVNIPWPDNNNPLNKIIGWRQLGQKVSLTLSEMDPQTPCFIVSDRYMYSSTLAFYVEGQPITYCVNLDRRMNQYDLWPGFENRIGDNAIFVSRYKMAEDFQNAFESVETRKVELKNNLGRTIRTAVICKCLHFKGWQPREIDQF